MISIIVICYYTVDCWLGLLTVDCSYFLFYMKNGNILRVSSLLQTSLGTRPPTAQHQVIQALEVALLYPFFIL